MEICAREDEEEDNYEERMRGTYSLQMALYQQAVARATGIMPSDIEAIIFCTAIGREVDMTADTAALAAAEEKVSTALDSIEREAFEAPAIEGREEHVCRGCPYRELTGCGETRWTGSKSEREWEPADGIDDDARDDGDEST